MIFVSVILPAYKSTYLNYAIESIISQTYTNFELIIVDAASPEDIKGVVSKFSDERIKYYKNQENIGGKSLVAQWNHCMQYASGEYFVLAADDDIYHTEFLQSCIDLVKKYPEVNLIRTGAEQIDENNNLIGLDNILPEYCSKYQFLYYWYTATLFTCIGNYMFKTQVLKERKFIDFPFAFGSDVATTIMMADQGVANTKDMLFQFRISNIHLSSSKMHLEPKLLATTQLYIWLMNIKYAAPLNKYDSFCYNRTLQKDLYVKCKYDYYNQVVKYLPFYKINWINRCKLLSNKDKTVMLLRYIADRIMK